MGDLKIIILVGTFIVFFNSIIHNSMATSSLVDQLPNTAGGATFDVVMFGAVGDGVTDDSKAFLATWRSVCSSLGTPVFVVPPAKSFLLKPIAFLGPCTSSQIQFLLQGNIVAPSSFDGWTNCKENSWIYFGDVQSLHFTGLGTIHGSGDLWWPRKPVSPGTGCEKPPTALRFHACNGLQLNGTTHLNSPWNHIEVEASQNVEMSNLNITAPSDSPNTDGIDIATSSNVYIHDSKIGTGDDCIAIKGGSYFINITGVHCGPGHGISVGSLGKGGADEIVEHVFVSDCILNGTTNGARIKTWQGGLGHVSDITFQDVTLVNSKYPIIIDQLYDDLTKESAVKVSDVIFRGFRGTSATETAISLECSGRTPCTNLKFDDIKINSEIGGEITSKCQFAYGIIVPPVVPNVTCLLR